MSDDTHSERVIPATWEEYQQERRVAFEVGALYGWGGGNTWMAEAARRYPITRKVPRVVKDRFGVWWKVDGSQLLRRTDTRSGWVGTSVRPSEATVDRVRLWADLLDNPFEEVTE